MVTQCAIWKVVLPILLAASIFTAMPAGAALTASAVLTSGCPASHYTVDAYGNASEYYESTNWVMVTGETPGAHWLMSWSMDLFRTTSLDAGHWDVQSDISTHDFYLDSNGSWSRTAPNASPWVLRGTQVLQAGSFRAHSKSTLTAGLFGGGNSSAPPSEDIRGFDVS